MRLRHEFVKSVPEVLEPGVVYISMEYRVAIHGCCCGCGKKVVTPFSPKGWKLIFDGKTISIRPSIGNWNFECKSHYWITNNKVQWARSWREKESRHNHEGDMHSRARSSKQGKIGILRNFLRKRSAQ